MVSRRCVSRAGFLLFASLTVLGLAACAAAADSTWKRVRESGVLRVGMDAGFPPFEAVASDGTLVGFDVDLAREVSRQLDLEPQFVANLPYDGLYDALRAQRVDVVLSALAINRARTADYAYSTPYFDAGEVLVVPEGEDRIQTISDANGHRLAVALGTQGDQEARKWTRRLTDLTVVQYQTPADALRAVEGGEIDVALVDHVSALQAIGGGRSLAVVEDPVLSVPYAAAVRQDSRRLLQAINEALEKTEDDGTMDRLVTKWLRGD